MPAPPAPCTICGTTTEQRCIVCRAAQYCSVKCQEMDWPLHKLLCKNYRDFIATRPKRRVVHEEFHAESPYDDVLEDDLDTIFDYKLALLFPHMSKQPKPAWVEVQVTLGNEMDGREEGGLLGIPSTLSGERHELPFPGSHIKPESSIDKYAPRDNENEISKKGYIVRTSEHIFLNGRIFQHFWLHTEEADDEENGVNQYLQELNVGYSRTCLSNRSTLGPTGNQVLMRCERFIASVGQWEGMRQYYHDITLGDLRLAFEHFSKDHNTFEGSTPNKYCIRQNMRWTKVVRLCSDYAAKLGAPLYQELDIREDHDAFFQIDATSSIANHLGFPLHISKIKEIDWNPHKLAGRKITEHSLAYKHTLLTMNADNTSLEWGKAASWKWEKGSDLSLINARENKEDLTAQQVEASIAYTGKLRPLSASMRNDNFARNHNMSDDATNMASTMQHMYVERASMVGEHLNPNAFIQFFAKLKLHKLAAGDLSWTDAKPPLPSKAHDTQVRCDFTEQRRVPNSSQSQNEARSQAETKAVQHQHMGEHQRGLQEIQSQKKKDGQNSQGTKGSTEQRRSTKRQLKSGSEAVQPTKKTRDK